MISYIESDSSTIQAEKIKLIIAMYPYIQFTSHNLAFWHIKFGKRDLVVFGGEYRNYIYCGHG